MQLGDTFVIKGGMGHLVIILSDPSIDPNRIITVNLTSWHERKDQACVLRPGEHPWIRKKTVVNYKSAQVTNTSVLNKQLRMNMLELYPDPVSSPVLKAILNGVRLSKQVPRGVRQILIAQKLMPDDTHGSLDA